ncbi:MAG: TonB-dependent receptor [Spirosoma sp.]|nr:TonB-dependent receptor [Spirosoma sp.]
MTARGVSKIGTLVLGSLLIIFSQGVKGQNGLAGRITDKNTTEPLVGVSIYIHDLRQGAVTDTAGRYHLVNLPTGRFLVEVSYLGYASAVQAVTLNGEQTLDFTLSASPTELNGVTVTGVSAATEVRRSPIPMQIIGRTVLQQAVATNLIDALARQPGISQVSTGPAISKPVIRGLSYNRVITLYNGVRHEGQQWGDEHGLEVDEYAVDRVEIIKGPGSLLYGSDGIAGVINLLAPTPEPEGHISGQMLANYQTNNGLIGYSAMTTGTRKGINWLARVSGKKAGNYQNAYDGRVYNSGFRELDMNGYVGINRKWGYSQVHFSSFDQHTAITEGERDSTGRFTQPIVESDGSFGSQPVSEHALSGYGLGIPNQRIRHQRLLLINNIYVGASRLAFNGGYQLSQRQEFGEVTNPTRYGLYFYLPTLTYDLKYFFPEHNGWKTTIGASGMSQQNKNKGSKFLIPDYQLFDAGGFVFTQKAFERFDISGGLRYDQRQITTQDLLLANDQRVPAGTPGAVTKFTGFTAYYGNYSGSVGASYQVSPHLLVKGNVARGYRAPNMAEIGSNGRHEGTFRYEIGTRL